MVFVIMTIWEGTEKGHHRVYVLRQHRYGKPLWNVLEHPPPFDLSGDLSKLYLMISTSWTASATVSRGTEFRRTMIRLTGSFQIYRVPVEAPMESLLPGHQAI